MSSPWTGEMSTKSGSESQRRVHVCVFVCVTYLSGCQSLLALLIRCLTSTEITGSTDF